MPPTKAPGRANSIMSVVIMLVIIGFSWRSCWYATKLSDSDMVELLGGEGNDSRIHKALSQFVDRAENKDPRVKDWYDLVAKLGQHKTSQIRSTAAWAMGYIKDYPPFIPVLTAMLDDEELQVRYNAAVSLGAAKQKVARPILRLMLNEHAIKSPIDGTLEEPRAQGEYVRFGKILARLKTQDGKKTNLIAPLDGRLSRVGVRHGKAVKMGDELFVIEPSEGQLKNAIIALARCGSADDLDVLAPIKEGRFGANTSTQELAREAIKALSAQ